MAIKGEKAEHRAGRALGMLRLGGLLACVWLSGCGATTASVSNPFHTSAAHAHVGQQVHLGSLWIATMSSVATQTSVEGQSAAGGETFLVVMAAFKNVSTSAQTLYTAATVVLQDAADHRYAQANVATTPAVDGIVGAGQTSAGPLYFQVPSTQRSFELAYQGLDAGDGTAVWDLTLPS